MRPFAQLGFGWRFCFILVFCVVVYYAEFVCCMWMRMIGQSSRSSVFSSLPVFGSTLRARASSVRVPIRVRSSLLLMSTDVVVFSSSISIMRYDSGSVSSPLAVLTFLFVICGSFSFSLRLVGIVVNVAPVSTRDSVVTLWLVVGLVSLTLT